MSRLGRRARRFISARIDHHADGIEAVILQDRVLEADDGAPETLYHLATAAEQTYHELGNRELSQPVHSGAADAFDEVKDALDAFIDELVARECLAVIENADRWAEEWDRHDADFDAAKHEAREWLQKNIDAAKRAGVLEELDVAGAAEAGR